MPSNGEQISKEGSREGAAVAVGAGSVAVGALIVGITGLGVASAGCTVGMKESGAGWQAAKAQAPRKKALISFFARSRFLIQPSIPDLHPIVLIILQTPGRKTNRRLPAGLQRC